MDHEPGRPRTTVASSHETAASDTRFLGRFLRGGAVLSVARVGSQAIWMGCIALYARLLPDEQLGIAMAVLTTVSLAEMLSELGIQQRLLQVDGDDFEATLANGHCVNAVRGVSIAAFLTATAYPFAWLFNMPDNPWPFAAVAFVPLVRGFQHRGNVGSQRELNFGPTFAINVIPQAVGLATVVPAVAWLGDYSAFLFTVAVRASLTVAVSHGFVPIRFRIAYDRRVIKRLVVFGAPLMFNGLLLYATNHGYRVLVGANYTLADMAVFSLIATFTFMPSIVVMSVLQSLFLPMVSAASGLDERLRKLRGLASASAAAGVGLFAFHVVFGRAIEALLGAGEKYLLFADLAPVLALAAAVRILQVTPLIAILAGGKTGGVLAGSLARLSGLIAAVAAATAGADLMTVCWTVVAGECAGMAASIIAVSRFTDGPVPTLTATVGPPAAACVAVWAAAAVVDPWLGMTSFGVFFPVAAGCVAVVAVGLSGRSFFDAMRDRAPVGLRQ
ncbi:MAG: oligosaccharide flippase family protein [Planctomycetota bacterium]